MCIMSSFPVSNAAAARDISPLQNTQTGSGAGTTSIQRVRVFSSLSGKRTERDVDPTSLLEPKLRESIFAYFCPL